MVGSNEFIGLAQSPAPLVPRKVVVRFLEFVALCVLAVLLALAFGAGRAGASTGGGVLTPVNQAVAAVTAPVAPVISTANERSRRHGKDADGS